MTNIRLATLVDVAELVQMRWDFFRSQGFGSQIQIAMEKWSKENHVEFLIVGPSNESVPIYSRNGFSLCEEAMEKHW